MDKYLEFLEQHLGEIESGWNKGADDESMPFQIVKFKEGPFPGTVTYATLGLSNEQLFCPRTNKLIKQELFLVAYREFGDANIPGILQQMGQAALSNSKAFLRGDVVGPYGPLFDSSQLEAIYVTMPVYFPNSFFTFKAKDISIVQAWLVPITANEASYIHESGWDDFEGMLEEKNPDLIDFKRKSMV